MSTSNMLTVVGILATVVFGVFGIWGFVIVIRRRYPGQLTYVKESYLGLFDSIVKNLPELAVLYNNLPVGQGLVLVKGAILNTGNKDITDSMVEQKLALALPSDFHWLTAKIVGNSENVKASLAIQDNSLVVSTGLFRRNEFIRFQAIVEVPIRAESDGRKSESIEDRLDKAISITHRIEDTQKVLERELPSTGRTKHRMLWSLSMCLGLMATMGVSFGIFLFRGFPAETHFVVNDTNSIPHEVRTRLRLDGSMTLKGVGDDFREQTTVDDFFKRGSLKPKVALELETKVITIGGLLYLMCPLAMFLYAYREYRNANKLRQLLGIKDHQDAPTEKSTMSSAS
ncbi:MAG: hypothetical protein NTZ17_00255 [Phycisphaerae bacterium]|nr:hypothetical protein [Phycisphaerae bacterium]